MAAADHDRERPAAARPARPAGAAPPPRSVAARALALQQRLGNRRAARVLARWTRHPDPEKKGVMVPDVAATEHEHFNPPQNA